MRIILTGATGMVGEGVLLECLANNKVSEVLLLSRKHYDLTHPKLKELLVPDFLKISTLKEKIEGYDACFFCAGISSVGMSAEKFSSITYDTTLAVAQFLLQHNSNMVFIYVSGKSTDSSEKGSIMWARVKGKTENDLMKLGFKGQYNFRPGLMTPTEGQKSLKLFFILMAGILKYIIPKSTLKLSEVGKAMINISEKGYPKQILEIKDIKLASL